MALRVGQRKASTWLVVNERLSLDLFGFTACCVLYAESHRQLDMMALNKLLSITLSLLTGSRILVRHPSSIGPENLS